MTDGLEIVTGGDAPDFLDLPWSTPLATWASDRMVDFTIAPARHVVRLVDYDAQVYALKETTADLARREFATLRTLQDAHLPTVTPVGVVTGRTSADGSALDAVLITRFLEYSLPYHYLFQDLRDGTEHDRDLRNRLLDAAAVLFVRLHTNGVFWGDASLGNVLFRRDAGAFMAYLVDAETTEVHPSLSDSMRDHDLMIARENVAGALLDAVAAGTLRAETDVVDVVDELEARYLRLWDEIQGTEVVGADERWRIQARIERLQALGFDVEQLRLVTMDGGTRLLIQPQCVDEGHSHRRLRRLTGLEAQEGQARKLLAGIWAHGAWMEREAGRDLHESVVAQHWLTERYHALVSRVPDDLADRVDGPELFHLFMGYRDARAEAEGADPDIDEAMDTFISSVLPTLRPERLIGE